jgi:DNA transposase THAP9
VTEKLLSADGQSFFETQLKLATRHSKGRRYSNSMKNLSLSLHYRGAKAYRFLSTIFTLPSKSSLHLWLQRLNVPAGLSNDVWDVLKLRVDGLSSRDRVCALLLDEIALKFNLSYNRYDDFIVGFEDIGDGKRGKQLANSSLVFMVRGLAYNWKQPLGYVLTHSTAKSIVVKSLLFECLDRLQAIGLHVVVVVSDQGPNFQQLVRNLGITAQKPYFEHSGSKYFYMFDPPHLLKSIRNNLQKYSLVFGGNKVASWADIESFFKLDQQQRFRLAPRLTPKHIELPAFSKMKVKLAAQVISRSVASGLETHAVFKFGHGSDTAEFITAFDDLFDALNSSQRNCIKKFKCALSNSTEHIALFKQSLEMLKSLKAVDSHGNDVTNQVKCIAGWQLTLSAVINLWPHLNSIYNFEFLLTRRLNQDALENFFSVIRQHGGNCVNPTALTYSRLFRQVCCNTLFKPVIGSNCEIDCADVLASLNSNTKPLVPLTSIAPGEKSVDQFIDLNLTCTNEDELEDNGLSYVCGFLLRRLLKWHSCADCSSLWVNKADCSGEVRHSYTTLRLYEGDELKGGKGLVFVSSEFFAYVRQLEDTFDVCYKQHSYALGISRLIVDELMHHPLPLSCTQFPKLRFLRYFVRVRIYYKLKFANVSAKQATVCSKNRKLKNLQHK